MIWLRIVGPPLLKLMVSIVGDYLLGKWVAQLRLFFRKNAEPTLQRYADDEYVRLEKEWNLLRDERQGRKP